MKSGDTFVVDAQALGELAGFYKMDEASFKNIEGVTFSIANSKSAPAITSSEVRASKWKDGKPSRGRPRKFPRTTVARLLGEPDDFSSHLADADAPVVVEALEEVDNLAEAAKTLVAEELSEVRATESSVDNVLSLVPGSDEEDEADDGDDW